MAEPRSKSAIPAAYAWKNGALKFRPGGFDYDWSAQQLRCAKVIEGHATLTCRTKDSEVAPVVVLLEVVRQRLYVITCCCCFSSKFGFLVSTHFSVCKLIADMR